MCVCVSVGILWKDRCGENIFALLARRIVFCSVCVICRTFLCTFWNIGFFGMWSYCFVR